jgi:uncharacterized Zn-finger protein
MSPLLPHTTISKQKNILICDKDLPLACPNVNTPVWNQHPRVYLALDSSGHAVCPYCSASYQLEAKVNN